MLIARTSSPLTLVYMNFQLLTCTAHMSPCAWWALTPPSHPYPTAIMTAGGCFLLHWFTLTDDFPLRSRILYVARTFLLHLKKRMHTASRPTDSYVTRRYKKINVYECRMLKKMYFCKLMKRLAYILRLC